MWEDGDGAAVGVVLPAEGVALFLKLFDDVADALERRAGGDVTSVGGGGGEGRCGEPEGGEKSLREKHDGRLGERIN